MPFDVILKKERIWIILGWCVWGCSLESSSTLLSVDWPNWENQQLVERPWVGCSTQNLKFLKLVLLISWMAGVYGDACSADRQALVGSGRQLAGSCLIELSRLDCISRRGHQLKTNSRPTKRLQAVATFTSEAVQSRVTPCSLWWLLYILYFTKHLGEEQILSLVWWIRKSKDRMVLSHFHCARLSADQYLLFTSNWMWL